MTDWLILGFIISLSIIAWTLQDIKSILESILESDKAIQYKIKRRNRWKE